MNETGATGVCRISVLANADAAIRLANHIAIQLSNSGERNDQFNVHFLHPSLFELRAGVRNVRLCLPT